MAENSKISWTTHTWNPWHGCTKVSDGCKNCYAETLSKRFGRQIWGPKAGRKLLSDAYWQDPLKRNADAEAVIASGGERPRVFCASMADVFEGEKTCQDAEAYAGIVAARARLWTLIETTPNLDWLLLTKRPQNIKAMIPSRWLEKVWLPSGAMGTRFPFNVWLGTSVEDQAAAEARINHLLQVPAPVHFLSGEPLLGPVQLDLPYYCCRTCGWPLGFDAEALGTITLSAEERAAYDAFLANGCANCKATHGYWSIASWLDDIE